MPVNPEFSQAVASTTLGDFASHQLESRHDNGTDDRPICEQFIAFEEYGRGNNTCHNVQAEVKCHN